ncbi:hypothetical protein F5984_23890 [Rudanella paleaurantiibacter]|uniref:Uncharacterized protein n=1 Tax=Rudanella paleaurantiibacter TaxID=2614655 RepID=A0A7J5TT19_9BACT|nr:hypothetical protein [Rudanella paleaurantiibacter]KAB7726673.1 hypothetical protein F5984_23890 [Rudanella paleaurantiibacter]
MRKQRILLFLWAGLTACSGNTGSSETGASSATKDVPESFVGAWVNDVPARTPPDPQPDHYDRTEYVIQKSGGITTLTKYAAAVDLKTGKEWFRNLSAGPLTCTYIQDRACLACGADQQPVKDSLFVKSGKLVNQSPLASNRTAAGRGPLVLTRKPDNKP